MAVSRLDVESSYSTCPHCGSARLVLDPETYELVCTRCGTVVETHLLQLNYGPKADDAVYEHCFTSAGPVHSTLLVRLMQRKITKYLARLAVLFNMDFSTVLNIFAHEYNYLKSRRGDGVQRTSTLRERLMQLRVRREGDEKTGYSLCRAALFRTIARILQRCGHVVSIESVKHVYKTVANTSRDISNRRLYEVISDILRESLKTAHIARRKVAAHIAHAALSRLGIDVSLDLVETLVDKAMSMYAGRIGTIALAVTLAIAEAVKHGLAQDYVVETVREVCRELKVNPPGRHALRGYSSLRRLVVKLREEAVKSLQQLSVQSH